MNRGAWQATVHGVTESDMTEHTYTHTHTHTHIHLIIVFTYLNLGENLLNKICEIIFTKWKTSK